MYLFYVHGINRILTPVSSEAEDIYKEMGEWRPGLRHRRAEDDRQDPRPPGPLESAETPIYDWSTYVNIFIFISRKKFPRKCAVGASTQSRHVFKCLLK